MSTVVDANIAAKFIRVPLTEIANPKKRGPLMTYQDHWWASDDDGNGFLFRGKYPQCNTSRLLVERTLAQGLATHAVLLPWAYLQFDMSDYV